MFNSLSQLPKAPYSILTFLALNNENIWKMIKYNSYDALSKPNLMNASTASAAFSCASFIKGASSLLVFQVHNLQQEY